MITNEIVTPEIVTDQIVTAVKIVTNQIAISNLLLLDCYYSIGDYSYFCYYKHFSATFFLLGKIQQC